MEQNRLLSVPIPERSRNPNKLLDQARNLYPVLRDVEMGFKYNPTPDRGFLEYWPPNEPGAPNYPRPKEFPIDQPSLEVFDERTRPIDILGDVTSHQLIKSDPQVQQYYQSFVNSLTPEQEQRLKSQYEHSVQNFGETRPFEQWKEISGLPAYFRGYAFQQWPEDFNERAYTPEQRAKFDQMLQYLRGK